MVKRLKIGLENQLRRSKWYLIVVLLFLAMFYYISSKLKISYLFKTISVFSYSYIYCVWIFQILFVLLLPDVIKNKILRNIINILWLPVMLLLYIVFAVILNIVDWYGPIWCTAGNLPLIIVIGLTLLVYGMYLFYRWKYVPNFKSKYNLIIALCSIIFPLFFGFVIYKKSCLNSYQKALNKEAFYLNQRLGSLQGVKDFIYEYDLWCVHIDDSLNGYTNDEKRNFYIEFTGGTVKFSTSGKEEGITMLAKNIKTYDYEINQRNWWKEYVVEWKTENAKYTFDPQNRKLTYQYNNGKSFDVILWCARSMDFRKDVHTPTDKETKGQGSSE